MGPQGREGAISPHCSGWHVDRHHCVQVIPVAVCLEWDGHVLQRKHPTTPKLLHSFLPSSVMRSEPWRGEYKCPNHVIIGYSAPNRTAVQAEYNYSELAWYRKMASATVTGGFYKETTHSKSKCQTIIMPGKDFPNLYSHLYYVHEETEAGSGILCDFSSHEVDQIAISNF